MTKVLPVFLIGFLVTSVFAVPDNAIDFTAKGIDGKTHHLFSYLEAGNYVMLNFNLRN